MRIHLTVQTTFYVLGIIGILLGAIGWLTNWQPALGLASSKDLSAEIIRSETADSVSLKWRARADTVLGTLADRQVLTIAAVLLSDQTAEERNKILLDLATRTDKRSIDADAMIKQILANTTTAKNKKR